MTGTDSTDNRPQTREGSETTIEARTAASAETTSRPSAHVRWAQRGYVLVAGIVMVGIVIQVFIAGMAIFVNPAMWELHATFANLLFVPFLLLLVLAFIGRLSREFKWLSLGLFLLLFGQAVTATAFGYGSLVAALHPVNALVIFWLAVVNFRRAWRSVSVSAGAVS